VLGVLCATGVLFLSCSSVETTNKWFKVAPDDPTSGGVVVLDMSKGYSYSNGEYILIVVQDSNNNDEIVIAFPNGGYWTAPVLNPELNKSTAWKKTY
jgi:hypothetical protein